MTHTKKKLQGGDIMTNEEKKMEVERHENVEFVKNQLINDNLGFTEESQWEALTSHVEVHKYLLDQESGENYSFKAAFESWKEKVYAPLMQVIDWWEVKKAFTSYTKGQLLFAVSTHWYYMLEKDPETAPENAAVDFAAYYGKGIASWVSLMRAAAAMRAQYAYYE